MNSLRLLLFLCLLVGLNTAVHAQSVLSSWQPNGPVYSVIVTGNTVYIGGQFNALVPTTSATGRGAAISLTTGQANMSFPKVNGDIYTAIADGAGGFYIGGYFTRVGGVSRHYLARINSDGSLNPWNPDPDSYVTTLCLSGGKIYVGGSFSSIGGQSRTSLAALDTTNGIAFAWNPSPNNVIQAFAVTGNTIMVGGSFTAISGVTRNSLAALDLTTGNALSWNPGANGTVYTMATTGGTLYVGGSFTTISGVTRNYIAALNTITGSALAWNPNAGNVVSSLAYANNILYAGGFFSSIGGQSRICIAALNTTSGNATAWNPSASAQVTSILVNGNSIYAGGWFNIMNGQTRNHIAEIGVTTGTVTAWNPNANNDVNTLALSGSTFYAGGAFNAIGTWTARNNIAALDATTGAPTSWNPGASSTVHCLSLSGNTLYLGGEFSAVGGQTRIFLAALNATTGTTASWNPGANGVVYALAVTGSTVYAGGSFTTISGVTHNYITAINALTGVPTAWNPGANGTVETLAATNNTVYAGGVFTSIGGQSRNRLAALSAATGLATAWNPDVTGFVYSSMLTGNTLYIGGNINAVGAQNRASLAAVDVATGLATPWNPGEGGNVNGFAAVGNIIYTAGYFPTIGGHNRSHLAALDATTSATVYPWDAAVDNGLNTLAAGNGNIYVGGNFTTIGGMDRDYFAILTSYSPATALAMSNVSPASPTDRQQFSITVEARAANGIPAQVTHATVVSLNFSHPKLILMSGNTQATIAADQSSTTCTLTLVNTTTSTISTSFTISTLLGNLTATTQTIAIQPAPPASHLAITQITPSAPNSDQSFSVVVEARNSVNALMPVTQATVVSISFSHPKLTLIGGSTQATMTAGQSSTTLTISVRNTGSTTATALFTVAAGGLTATGQTVSIQPPPSHLIFTSVQPAIPLSGQPFSIIVETRNNNDLVVPVTQATVVNVLFQNIRLALAAGSTQAIIAAGQATTTLTLSVHNLATITVSTTFTIQGSGVAATSQSIAIEPPASHLTITSIIPATPYSGQVFSFTVAARNDNEAIVPVTQATLLQMSLPTSPLSIAFGNTQVAMAVGQSTASFTLSLANSDPVTIVTTCTISTTNASLTSTTAGLSILASPAGNSFPNLSAWIPSGAVYAVIVTGNTVYIGGEFTSLVPTTSFTGHGVLLDPATGLPNMTFPKIDGVIYTVVPDGVGGVYIGGSFSNVGGFPRASAARINADGTVHPWDPNISGQVNTLYVAGGTVYIGGSIYSVGGQTRNRLAAVDTSAGSVLSWNPDANNMIQTLAVSGNTVYATGYFTTIGGMSRNHIAALDATTGTVTSWDPNPNSYIDALIVTGNTVYVGGEFTSIGGTTRNYIAALNTTSGSATSWNPVAASYVYALAVTGNTIYAGGYFGLIGGQSHSYIAAISTTSGTATSWDPGADDAITSLRISGNILYATGYFSSIGGQNRHYLAALDRTSGNATSWNPHPNGYVSMLATAGAGIYAGGSFNGVGQWVSRNYLAALDAVTGAPLSWAPDADNSVSSLALADSLLYVGGYFSNIAGQTHNYIAAISTTTGLPTAWDPGANNPVYKITPAGSTIYAGGDFSFIGGQSRNHLAALNATTGNATSWAPEANSTVRAITVSNGYIYIGGDFSFTGGQSRNYIAALDPITGNATSWNPNPNSQVLTMLATHNHIYAGGYFSSIGGQSRNYIAALDPITGNPTPWAPELDGNMNSMAGVGNTLYTNGWFTSISGQNRSYIAALDITTDSALVLPWSPDANNSGYSIAATDKYVVVSGGFTRIAGTDRDGFAILSPYAPATQLAIAGVSPSLPISTQSMNIIVQARSATGQGMGVTQTIPVSVIFSHPFLSLMGGSTQATIETGQSSTTLTLTINNTSTATISTTFTISTTTNTLSATSQTISIQPTPSASRLALTQVMPATPGSEQAFSIRVESQNIFKNPIAVTQSTLVGIAFSHPNLTLTGGSTQATIVAGQYSTTITINVRNSTTTTATTLFTVNSMTGGLIATSQSISIEPAATHLTLMSILPTTPYSGQTFSVTVAAHNNNEFSVPVTQATLLQMAPFSSPLSLVYGSSQTSLAAGQSTTSFTLTLMNSSAGTASTACTISSINASLIATTAGLSILTGPSGNSFPNLSTWIPSGPINTLVVTGNTVYMGGNFTSFLPVTSATGHGTWIDLSTGRADITFSRVDGIIYTVVPDGAGGVYVGGYFSSIAGQTRHNAARINADGSLHPWNPDVSSVVYTLYATGATVYIGGSFSNVGAQTRNYIAAVDTSVGNVLSWNPNAGSSVLTLTGNGSMIYAGGYFTTIGGIARNRIAAFNATTGTLTAWDPNANGAVRALIATGNTVYVGGEFSSIGGQNRNYIAALDATSGAATSWNPDANSYIYTLALADSIIYAGGYFSIINSQSRNHLSAIRVTSGTVTTWNPDASDLVNVLTVNATTVYAGGYFNTVGGQNRNNLAALDRTTGTVTSWNPNPNGAVNTLTFLGSGIYAGGQFNGVGQWVRRNYAAALDAITGIPLPWNPDADGVVQTLVLTDSLLYAGGQFSIVGGQNRAYIAALDRSTGTANAWNPGANYTVQTMMAVGPTIYVGGDFSSIGGQSRSFMAALDSATGLATSWNPNPNNTVRTFATLGGTIYVGGDFTSISGQNRGYIAALDPATGAATSWHPDANNLILNLLSAHGHIYAGGYFYAIGGQNRSYIAALDPITGLATAWDPSADNIVNALTSIGNTIYAAGWFTSVGGQSHTHLAALDATVNTENALPWDPSPNAITTVLAAGNNYIATAGSFTMIAGIAKDGFAILSPYIPATQLVITGITSAVPASGQSFTINVQTRTTTGQPMAVTQATLVSISFSNPFLTPGSGSTQATILAGENSTSITLSFVNSSTAQQTIALTLTPIGPLTITNQTITVMAPIASRLAMTNITTPVASDQLCTITVESRNPSDVTMPVTQATLLGMTFSSSGLALSSGTTQATLQTGQSSTTITIALHNNSNTTMTTSLTVSAVNGGLTATTQTLSVQAPPAILLALTSVLPPAPGNGQSFTLTVQSRNVNGLTMPVTQATLVGANFSNPFLGLLSGSTQSTLQVGQSSTTITLSVLNSSSASIATPFTIAAANSSLTSTQQSITIQACGHFPVTISTNGSTSFCAGGSVQLTVSTGATYLWSNGATSQSITVSPAITTSYSVTVATVLGCQSSTMITITVHPVPGASITASGSTVLCQGSAVQLTATAAVSYLWSNGATTQSITISPASTTLYTVTVANIQGCTRSSSLTVTVNPLPVATVTPSGSTTFCGGGSVQLTASTNASYLWSNGATTQSITVSPASTTVYTITVANVQGCLRSSSLTVTVNPLPVAIITPSGSTTFCGSGSVQLTATANSSYLWSNGATTQSITVSPTSTTLYTVTVANVQGCTRSSSLTVTVNPLPVAVITPSGSTTFCAGGSVQLTATANSSYLWSNGATTQSITVSPASTTVYTVTVATIQGCAQSSSLTVTVNPSPVAAITPSGSTTFCGGGSVQLTASTNASYLWSNGATTQSITVSPVATTVYTVTVATIQGCVQSSSLTVTVNPLPVAAITPSGSTTFCAGGSVQLTATANSSYLWSNGATTQSITVSPTSTTVYTVTVATIQGCSQSSSLTVTVNPSPIAAITPSGSTTFCGGGSVQLTASTNANYLWSNGATTQSITVSPIATTVYTVTVATIQGCVKSSSLTVTVNPLPVAAITPSGSTTFCAGGSVQLTATANSSYLWSNGVTTQSITVSPASTTVYTVTVATIQGCAQSSSLTVTINPLPVAAITPSGPTSLCAGGSVQLTASTNASYLWSNGATTQSITISPAGTTLYTVTVANVQGCLRSSSLTVTVSSLPVAAITPSGSTTFCAGGSVQLTATANSSYLWSNGATTQSITISPATTTVYTVTMANVQGCTRSSSLTVTVNPMPQPVISGVNSACPNTDSHVYSVADLPGSTFTWNVVGGTVTSGQNTNSITVTWGGQGTGQITVTHATLTCSSTANLTVTINPSLSPVIVPGGSITQCGGNILLDAGAGFSSYLWSNGAVTQTLTVTASGTYSVSVTDAGGCSGTSPGVTVTINPVPVADAGSDIVMCPHDIAQLQASGGIAYSWSPATALSNATIANPTASPSKTTTYIVTVTGGSGCTAQDTVTVIVDPYKFDITTMLEGAYNSGTMQTNLMTAGLLPLSQPFTGTPYFYGGIESLSSVPASTVDWVLLEARTTENPATTISRRAALLRSDGKIVDLDGNSTVAMPMESDPLPEAFHIVVRHRNHLSVMSANTIAGNCTIAYDFTTGQGQAYFVIGTPMKNLGSGVYGMIAADADPDGIINAADRVLIRNHTGATGYIQEDVTMDGLVGSADRVMVFNNKFLLSEVP